MIAKSTGLEMREYGHYWLKEKTQFDLVKDLFLENPDAKISIREALATIKEVNGIEIKRANLGNWFRREFRAKGILIEVYPKSNPSDISDLNATFQLNQNCKYCVRCWYAHDNDSNGNPTRTTVFDWDLENHLRKWHHFTDDNLARYGIESSFTIERPPAKHKDHEWQLIGLVDNHEIKLQCKQCSKTHTEYLRREECGGDYYAKWQQNEDNAIAENEAKKEAAQK